MPTAATTNANSNLSLISKQGAADLSTLTQLARGPAHGGHFRSLDDEGWPEIHWPRDIVEIGGGFQHGFVDLGELLLSAATLDADDTVEFFVARWHGWIDSEETAQVD